MLFSRKSIKVIKIIESVRSNLDIKRLLYSQKGNKMNSNSGNKKFVNAATQHANVSSSNHEDIIILSKTYSPKRETDDKVVWNDEFKPSNGNINYELLGTAEKKVNALSVSKEKRKASEESENPKKDTKKPKLDGKYLKASRPGFSDDRYNETSYYFENGLRKVYPYFFTFTTFTKGRWVGEKLLDVFAREFRAQSVEEFERCIKTGSLTVNYEKVPIDYQLKHNDLLANIVHRHEVPVTNEPIQIVFMDDEIVAVNKPASMPVHPCGRYRHNTVVFILAKEYNLKNLRTIHRLDRLTSGMLLFSRSQKRARQMEYQIRNRQVEKQYVCRVEGEFPDGKIYCNEPIDVVSYKIGVCKVSSKGKECATTFEKIGYDGKSSVVLCKPLTGRMHQIRVHLQYLGYPIINDPLYNHDVFGPNKGKGGDLGGKTDEQLIGDLIRIHNAENWLGLDGDSDISMFSVPAGSNILNQVVTNEDASSSKSTTFTSHLSDSTQNNSTRRESLNISTAEKTKSLGTQTDYECPDISFNPEKMTIDEHCNECKVRYKDPKPEDLSMYLHAWKYKGPGWEYETPLPFWARVE